MLEFIKAVFMYSTILGFLVTGGFVFLVLTGYGIRILSAAIVWVITMMVKLTGGNV